MNISSFNFRPIIQSQRMIVSIARVCSGSIDLSIKADCLQFYVAQVNEDPFMRVSSVVITSKDVFDFFWPYLIGWLLNFFGVLVELHHPFWF